MKLPEYLSENEFRLLYRAMPTNMMKDALHVMYVLALRISELCSLTADNVHLDHEVIRFTGKGSKVRELPITEEIKPIIMQALRRPGKLFNVEVRTFRNYVYSAASRADLGHVNPHMVRHSRATHLLNQGTDLADLKAIMRHECIQSTVIYTHVALGRMKAIMEKNHFSKSINY